MLTNQNSTKTFIEPRLLILTDPRIDYNALLESSYVNIPIISLCNTDNSLSYVDCAIPCNNRSKKSLAMIYWLLTKEVLALRGEEERFTDVPDLFMWRDVEKEKKEEAEKIAVPEGDERAEDGEGDLEGEENFIDDA
jgi:small subunit ribosomal protein SAe